MQYKKSFWTDEMKIRLADKIIEQYDTGKIIIIDMISFIRLLISENSPKPLFTTEDGVEMYRGDIYWYVDANDVTQDIYANSVNKYLNYDKNKNIVRFSSLEAAQEYIFNKKIIFSAADICKIYEEWIIDPNGLRLKDHLLIKALEKAGLGK